ncbi:MAG: SIS domain-containing protein [Clostridia bacterium]|nr:SIS domain-containing protein [Clostridia bacterium]
MESLYTRYPVLEACRKDIEAATDAIIDTYKKGGKVLLCGNGGSCADCDHIVGELMKGFLLRRPVSNEFEELLAKEGGEEGRALAKNLQGSLSAISLPGQTALVSAYCNDVEPAAVYAQLVLGHGNPEDVLICMSTSGNSKNIYYAALVAKAKGVKTIGMTGQKDSRLSAICDICIQVPETETYKIQELHLPVYHDICADVEAAFFDK